MMKAFVTGGSFFFTLVTEKRRHLFASADAVDVLLCAFRSVRSTRPFVLDAIGGIAVGVAALQFPPICRGWGL